MVWEDGGTAHTSGGEKYLTKAGHWYGGHNPCEQGWNHPECDGTWATKTTDYTTIHKGRCDLPLDEETCNTVRDDLDIDDDIIIKDRMYGWPRGCFLYTTSTGKKVLFYNKYDTGKSCKHNGTPLTCFCGIMGEDEENSREQMLFG